MHNYWEIYEDDDENDGFYHASHTTRRPSFEVATVGEAVAQLVETHRAAANHAFHGVIGFVARFVHFFLVNHHFRCLGGVAQFPRPRALYLVKPMRFHVTCSNAMRLPSLSTTQKLYLLVAFSPPSS